MDPESELGKYYSMDVFPFEAIETFPCLILLGEPGIGKTTALDREHQRWTVNTAGGKDELLWVDLRAYSTDQSLVERVFNSPVVRRWAAGTSVLNMFLDSLDEGLLQIRNISAVLSSEFKQLPTQRLRIRIACRSYEWQAGLESTLIQLFGEKNVGIFELAPLRRVDVITAARSEGIDPDRFVATMDDVGAVPFAVKPVSLLFLLDSFKQDGALPSSRVELYKRGCIQLAAETSLSRQDARVTGSLAPAQRLQIAARIAAVMNLSNRSAVSTRPYNELPLPEETTVDELIGGSEGGGPTFVNVNLAAIDEVLSTALFSAYGTNRFSWSHQTYGEFLSAFCLNEHNNSLAELRRMILDPAGSGKVVPQLRETAAWLASMNSEFFQFLLKSDPAVVMRSDLSSFSYSDRAKLAGRLLASFESEEILRDQFFQSSYSALSNPSIGSILRPFIVNMQRAESAREAAVEMAIACKVTSLEPDLVTLALDESQPYQLRTLAAMAIGKLGTVNGKLAIKSLLEEGSDNSDDELKAAILVALWPDLLPAEELFKWLTPPRRKNFVGGYVRFLTSDIANSLEEGDLPSALRWAKQNISANPELDYLAKIASRILNRAASFTFNKEIRNSLAEALVAQWELTFGHGQPASGFANSPSARRELSSSMVPLVTNSQFGALVLIDSCSLRSDDIPSLIQDTIGRSEAERGILAEAVRRLLRPEDVEIIGLVCESARENALLERELRPLIAAIELDSETARLMRSDYEQAKSYQLQRQSKPKTDRPDVGKLRSALALGGPLSFFKISAELGGLGASGEFPNEPLRGWSQLDPGLQADIVKGAWRYLTEFRPEGEDNRWQQGTFPAYMVVADRAIALLKSVAPRELENLSEEVWSFWAKVVVAYSPTNGWADIHPEILELTYSRAPDAVTEALGAVIDGQDTQWGRILVFQHFGDFWNERVADLTRSKLRLPHLRPQSFRDLLSVLLTKADRDARTLALSLLERIPASGEARQKAENAAAELLTHSEDAAWAIIWPIIKANERFGLAVFGSVVYGSNFGTAAFVSKLREPDIAELFLWLTSKGIPTEIEDEEGGFVTPERALYHWCWMLPNVLAHRGSAEACQALRSLRDALPGIPGLKFTVRDADERYRRLIWIPPTAHEVLTVLSNGSARIIMSADHLLEVILESLQRLQALLQGENPAAFDLWSDVGIVDIGGSQKRAFRPKDESAVSDYVKRHLDQHLVGRGVIVNREVEILRSTGGSPGERTDIYVAVGVPTSAPGLLEKVSVIVEVKGCWHAELLTAMRTQLVERYLKEYGSQRGIYLVGWFECPQWDERDARRSTCRKVNQQDLKRQLDLQAKELSSVGHRVEALVLDSTLR